MKTTAFLVHALSPLHAGTGHSADLIDLPTARMKGTNIPYVPGSSIKGVLRDQRSSESKDQDRIYATFGPTTDKSSEHAGALVVGDARVLAMPVRSFIGTFAWVSSPLLLRLAERDLGWGKLPRVELDERGARVTSTCSCLHKPRNRQETLYLEDLDLPARKDQSVDDWAKVLAKLAVPGDEDVFKRRFVVVDDETMTFLLETATQVDARVRLESETRTVARGALWLEESLPTETLLIGLMAADRSRRQNVDLSPEAILEFALGNECSVQLGGKATVGRGRCRLVPIPPSAPAPAPTPAPKTR